MKTNHPSPGALTNPDLRGTGKNFNTLLAGKEAAPDNYRLVLVEQTGAVYTPRHKHNFDQLRVCLRGRINYGRDNWILPGQMAYFPEGTPYGPEESDDERFGLTVQFGGASGSGYVSEEEVRRGTESLKKHGRFENGVFHRSTAQPGERRNQDASEAVWEHVRARKLEYPAPRYDAPILVKPENFSWQEQPGARGVALKHLGTFSERCLRLSMLKLESGSEGFIEARGGLQLGFVFAGSGSANGETVRQHSAFELGYGEGAVLRASSIMELLLIGLPIFEVSASKSENSQQELATA